VTPIHCHDLPAALTIDIIIPVYIRPAEAEAILDSLARQTDSDFGVVVVEDGSTRDCSAEVERFASGGAGTLRIQYLRKENGGPAAARNFGAERSKADFFIFFDSDVIVPSEYMAVVRRALVGGEASAGCEGRRGLTTASTLAGPSFAPARALEAGGVEFYGGPDMADPTFSPMQKAVSYSMTSLLTTGGIRGGKHSMERFTPRSFNMGVNRRLFEAVGGFSGDMRYGEDIDLSLRIAEAGTPGILLRDAGVYHRRRTNMRSFFRQVWHSGMARIDLARRHPGSLRPVHLLPMLFVMGSAACVALTFVSWWFLAPLVAICLVWFVDSSLRNRSIAVGALSVVTSMVQLWGYGTGMMAGVGTDAKPRAE